METCTLDEKVDLSLCFIIFGVVVGSHDYWVVYDVTNYFTDVIHHVFPKGSFTPQARP